MDLTTQGPATIPAEPTDSGPAPGTAGPSSADPGGQAGVSPPDAGQPAPGRAPQAEDFFDPALIADKPELQAAYRQMQAAFTKKTQALAAQRHKIEAYDAFERDPIATIQQIASQYGLHLTRAQAAEAARQQGGEEWQPQDWEEVMQRAEQRAEQRVLQRLAPVLQGVQGLQAKNIEAQLDSIDPNWRAYEDDMRSAIRRHPSLATDVAALYRLAVPQDVQESRATQAALRRLERKTEAAQLHGGNRSVRSTPGPAKIESFEDAVQEAKRRLAER